jgi:hypothetical protein
MAAINSSAEPEKAGRSGLSSDRRPGDDVNPPKTVTLINGIETAIRQEEVRDHGKETQQPRPETCHRNAHGAKSRPYVVGNEQRGPLDSLLSLSMGCRCPSSDIAKASQAPRKLPRTLDYVVPLSAA